MGMRFYHNSIRKNHRWDYVLFFLIGLFSLRWFQGSNFISADTFVWMPDFVSYFRNTLYVWDPSFSAGFSAVRAVSLLFPHIFYGTLVQEVFQLDFSFLYEKLLFYICFSSSGASAYFLLRTLRLGRLPSLFGGLFYMLNLFASVVVWYLSIGLFFPFYSFFPLMVALYIKVIRGEMNLVWANVVLALLPAVSSFSNPAFFVLWGGVLGAYTVFALGDRLLARDYAELGRILARAAGFGGVLILLSLFWILPLVGDLGGQYSSAANEQIGLVDDLRTLRLNSVTFKDALRLKGLWSFRGGVSGDLYYPWMPRFQLPLMSLLSYLLALITLVGGWAILRTRRGVDLVWLFLFTLFVFLVSGLETSLAPFLEKFYIRFPFFARAFRGGFTKYGFVLTLAYVVLFAFGVQFLTRSRKLTLSLFLTGSILLLGSPFLTGEVIYPGGKFARSFVIRFPEEYFTFQRWDAERLPSLGRYLSVPLGKNYNFVFNWKWGYQGGDYLRYLVTRPVVGDVTLHSIVKVLGELINQGETELAQAVAGLLGVQNIIFREDVGWQVSGMLFTGDRDRLSNFLAAHPLEKELGPFQVYRADESLFLPRIFVPKQLVVSQGGVGTLSDVIALSFPFPPRSGFLFFGEGYQGELPGTGKVDFIAGERSRLSFDMDSLQWHRGWPWPVESSVSPSSWLYPLVRWRERLAERRAQDNFSKHLDLLTWHGVKRVAEIKKFIDSDPRLDVEELVEAYLEAAGRVVELLQGVPEENRDDIYWGQCAKTLAYTVRAAGVARRLGFSGHARLETLAAELEGWLVTVGEDLCPEGWYCYLLPIVEEGYYEIYGDFSGGEGQQLIGSWDGGAQEPWQGSGSYLGTAMHYFGARFFQAGLRVLRVKGLVGENLVSDQLWTEAVFSHLSDSGGLDLGVASGLRYFVDRPPFQRSAMWSQVITGWEPNTAYRVSFDYRLEEDAGLNIAVFEDGYQEAQREDGRWVTGQSLETRAVWQEEIYASDRVLPNTDEDGWTHFVAGFESGLGSLSGDVFVSAFYNEIGPEIIRGTIKNMRIERAVEPEVILKRVQDSPSKQSEYASGGEGIPKIAFSRINLTKYRVKVSGAADPYHLVLNEGFHDGWKIYTSGAGEINRNTLPLVAEMNRNVGGLATWITDLFLDSGDYGEEVASYFNGEIKEMTHRSTFLEPATFETWGEEPLDSEHLEINGYANSWYIQPEDVGGAEDYELIIEFGPQRLFYVGLGVSILTLLGSVVYLGVSQVRPPRSASLKRSDLIRERENEKNQIPNT